MTVTELIESLKKYQPNAQVFIGTNCHGCFEPASDTILDESGVVVIEDKRRDGQRTY